MSVNKAFLVGKLNSDTELNYTSSGSAVCSFTIVTLERFKDKKGNKQERTETHNIVAWGDLAEFSEKALSKGTQSYIEGRIQRKTIDENGSKIYLSEIIASKIEVLNNPGDDIGDGGEDTGDDVFDPDAIPF